MTTHKGNPGFPHHSATPTDPGWSMGGPLPMERIEGERVLNASSEREALEGLEAIAPDERRNAYELLVCHLQDVGKAQAALPEAIRIAQGRGVSLSQAAVLVLKGRTLKSLAAADVEREEQAELERWLEGSMNEVEQKRREAEQGVIAAVRGAQDFLTTVVYQNIHPRHVSNLLAICEAMRRLDGLPAPAQLPHPAPGEEQEQEQGRVGGGE